MTLLSSDIDKRHWQARFSRSTAFKFEFGLLFGKAGFIILFSCDWTLSAILKHFGQLLGLEQTITILGLLLFNMPSSTGSFGADI